MRTKPFFPRRAAILLAVCVLAGCQSPPEVSSRGSGDNSATRNNSYSLLHQLLDEQKDVSLLRFIKREDVGVKDLINRIATASGAGAKRLEDLAKRDPSLHLDDLWLPPGETATREAIGAAKRKELLGQSGDTFELTLLLAQAEALSYASNLAKVAGANESNAEEARALDGIRQEMEKLYHEVFMMLRVKEG